MPTKVRKFGEDIMAALDFIDKLSPKRSSTKVKGHLHSRVIKEKRDKKGILVSLKTEWSVSYNKKKDRS